MKNIVLHTDNISKNFKSFCALKNVSVTLEKGKVYGLIGKNGAGKTSLMRIISGLSFQSSGSYTLFGEINEKGIQTARRKIGCLIEYPSLNGSMNAKDNLTLHMIMRGIKSKTLADELLTLVGLSAEPKKKVNDFSLGMRQRLGIAVALVGDPELLILDEPINGLDPIGVVEIRKLIRSLAEQRAMTVLISSHNLPELYQTASDYIIIDHGEIKKILDLKQLEQECQHYICVKTKMVTQLVSVLENELHTNKFKVADEQTINIYDFVGNEEILAKALCDNKIIATRFAVEGESLESYFIKVIGGDTVC